jgi:hypothetical protein
MLKHLVAIEKRQIFGIRPFLGQSKFGAIVAAGTDSDRWEDDTRLRLKGLSSCAWDGHARRVLRLFLEMCITILRMLKMPDSH